MNINDAVKELCSHLADSFYDRYANSKNDEFIQVVGRKYIKIVYRKVTSDGREIGQYAHAFVDKTNGDLYKPASWAVPAKGVRFNLIKDMEKIKEIADFTGGYLYR
jgi:hypothetical protein